jgi:hypothetical protein
MFLNFLQMLCQKGKGKRPSSTKKGKGKKKKIEEKEGNENICTVWSGKYDDSPDWIQCDSCNAWVHGRCVRITTSEQWEIYEDDNVPFICPFCK